MNTRIIRQYKNRLIKSGLYLYYIRNIKDDSVKLFELARQIDVNSSKETVKNQFEQILALLQQLNKQNLIYDNEYLSLLNNHNKVIAFLNL